MIKFSIGVNLLGSFIWFFNYITLGLTLAAAIGILQLLIAAFLIVNEVNSGRY